MAQWTDNEILFTTEVKEGDIISSPHFCNLLYRDVLELDPLLGFYVNPLKVHYTNTNMRTIVVEDIGLLTRRKAGKKTVTSFKFPLSDNVSFVVIYTESYMDTYKEYDTEEDRTGHYPLTVKARMLSPSKQWDPYGLTITFYMRSRVMKHCLEEVRLESSMIIEYKNFLS